MPDSSLLSIANARIDKLTCNLNTGIQHLFIQRDDLIHPIVSGNKWRKLQGSLERAKIEKLDGIISYGGAFSNHLIATAEACRIFQFPCTLIVRGEELTPHSNPYLSFCHRAGAKLLFAERSEYRELKKRDGIILFDGKKLLSVPEGGANRLGVEGCMNIVDPSYAFDIIALAQGTTTTSLGILLGSHPSSEIWCFPALKGFNALREMEQLATATGYLSEYNQHKHRLRIFDEFHYGGYAKKREQVINELADISFNPPILLDPIYTGKAFLGLLSEVRKSNFSKKKILFIHTGGVRSNALL